MGIVLCCQFLSSYTILALVNPLQLCAGILTRTPALLLVAFCFYRLMINLGKNTLLKGCDLLLIWESSRSDCNLIFRVFI